ncbi:MAG TPA: DNA repair protein RadA [Gemmatimonadaceae bacterium]|nr:DNA repair protein RadA [Gemmatimonadaceae bacterium]
MSPKALTIHRCTNCGADHPKWAGRCDVCGEWNTLVEEPLGARKAAGKSPGSRSKRAPAPAGAISILRNVSGAESARWTTGINEFDFVLGGGVVPGSMVLVGGEPGIGKSTLLLQVAARLQARPLRALYVSGEESALQVKLRSDRLTDAAGDVELLNETSLETILATAGAGRYDVMFVDSIQTVYTEELEGAPGSVGQVRECAARLMRFAKDSGTAVLVVGHVTKSGGIAGPKTLEHIVDTVLYFEGEGTAEHRVLRATKNRFGSVDEIGVFRMSGEGLVAVGNPSELFLGDRSRDTSGSAVTALMEGSRPLLVEVQGLAAKSGYGTPQRVATGYDSKRLALLLAVLERRAGLSFSQMDVFLNIAGGIRMQEPAGDLAVATALASSVFDRALPTDAMFIGEVGLGGEIRPVAQVERRLAEGAKLGITRAYVATRGVPQRAVKGVTVRGTATVQELFETVFA